MLTLATKSFPVVAGVLVSGAVAVSCVALVAVVLLVRRPLLATLIRAMIASFETMVGPILERNPRPSRLAAVVPLPPVPQAPPTLAPQGVITHPRRPDVTGRASRTR